MILTWLKQNQDELMLKPAKKRKDLFSLTCPEPSPSALHRSNMQPLKLLSSSITGKKEHKKHLSKHEQSQTNQQVASLSNKKNYFLSSHLQASSSSCRAHISAVATHQPIVSHRFKRQLHHHSIFSSPKSERARCSNIKSQGTRAAERMKPSSCPWQRRPPWLAALA